MITQEEKRNKVFMTMCEFSREDLIKIYSYCGLGVVRINKWTDKYNTICECIRSLTNRDINKIYKVICI